MDIYLYTIQRSVASLNILVGQPYNTTVIVLLFLLVFASDYSARIKHSLDDDASEAALSCVSDARNGQSNRNMR